MITTWRIFSIAASFLLIIQGCIPKTNVNLATSGLATFSVPEAIDGTRYLAHYLEGKKPDHLHWQKVADLPKPLVFEVGTYFFEIKDLGEGESVKKSSENCDETIRNGEEGIKKTLHEGANHVIISICGKNGSDVSTVSDCPNASGKSCVNIEVKMPDTPTSTNTTESESDIKEKCKLEKGGSASCLWVDPEYSVIKVNNNSNSVKFKKLIVKPNHAKDLKGFNCRLVAKFASVDAKTIDLTLKDIENLEVQYTEEYEWKPEAESGFNWNSDIFAKRGDFDVYSVCKGDVGDGVVWDKLDAEETEKYNDKWIKIGTLNGTHN